MTTAQILVQQQWLDQVNLIGATAGDAADAVATQAAILDGIEATWSLKTDQGVVLHRDDSLPPDCDTFELVDVTDYDFDADTPEDLPPIELPRDDDVAGD